MAVNFTAGKFSADTDAGDPLVGGLLYTYASGTTTPKATYTSATLGTTNTNPIVLDARGEAAVWLGSGAYTMVLKTAAGVTVYTEDGIKDPSLASQISVDDGQSGSLFTTLQGFISYLASSAGSAFIGFIQSGAGAVSRLVQSKLREIPTPADFGAVGDDTANDTAALQSLLDAHLRVDLGGVGKKYLITDSLTLRTGHHITGNGAEIRQATSNKEIFNGVSRSDITIHGVIARGVGSDFSDSDSSRAVFLYLGTSGSRISVTGSKFFNFSYTPVRCAAVSNVNFSNNYVEGPGSPTLTAISSGRCYGFLSDSGCSNVTAIGNTISKCAQGFRIEATSRFVVSGNVITDIVGQHGVYLGSALNDGVISGNTIRNVVLIGIKSQAQNGGSDNNRLSIIGNTIEDAGDQGILLSNGAGGTAQSIKNRNVTILGNSIKTTGGNGINVQNTIGASIVGNTVEASGQAGINVSASQHCTFSSNVITGSALSGITDESPSTGILLHGNQIRNCATSATAGNKYGLYVLDMTDWTIRNNIISDTAAKMQYGIYLAGGDQTTVIVADNQILNATDYGIRFKNGTDNTREYRSNLMAGTLGNAFNDPALPSVASASSITLPTQHDIVKITGTTNITSISANGHSGRKVTLLFDNSLSVVRGSNVQIASTFNATAQDTLTVGSDGVNWYEISRAVN